LNFFANLVIFPVAALIVTFDSDAKRRPEAVARECKMQFLK